MTEAGDVPSGEVAFGDLPSSEPYPGVHRRSVSTAQATLTSYSFDPGASFPLHSHEQEQITVVEEGSVEMTIDGEPHGLGPGEWTVVARNVPHGIVAGDGGARIVAIIVPRRASTDEIKVEGES